MQIPPHPVSVHIFHALCEPHSTCSQRLTIAPNLRRFTHRISRLLLPVTPLFSAADDRLIMVGSGAHSEGQHAEPQHIPHTDVCDIAIDSQGKPFMTQKPLLLTSSHMLPSFFGTIDCCFIVVILSTLLWLSCPRYCGYLIHANVCSHIKCGTMV